MLFPRRQLITIECANLKEQGRIEKFMNKCLNGNIYSMNIIVEDTYFIEIDINLEKSEYYSSQDIYIYFNKFYMLNFRVRYFDSNNERNTKCLDDCICYKCLFS